MTETATGATVAPEAGWREETLDRLDADWAEEPGLGSWIGTVDHKRIGLRYFYTGMAFFAAGGIESLLMRLQLAGPDLDVVGPEAYNQLFSMHGVTMMFLFAMPVLSGFGNYFVPLMIGARDMAFPRLNAFGYWVLLAAGLFMYSSFLFGAAPNNGWFNYVPLGDAEFTPGINIDYYALGLILLGISTTGGAINFIVTIVKLRAPGMTLNRIPIFVWGELAMALQIVFALPALTLAAVMLVLDRSFAFNFYDDGAGGDPLLWQHLFWVFGHPEVYIIALPGFGIASAIIPTWVRRPIVGYTYIVIGELAVALIGFGVWVHHMFAVGLPNMTLSFISLASFMVAIPSAIQVFAWLATLVSGRPVLRTPLLFVLGFVFIFVVGGVTGVMFAAVPFDQAVTDSYFVVAHLHYVLVGAAVFPIFGAIYHWGPKMTGRQLDERLGKWSFWLMFVGFNVAFFPQHILGLFGMPRRVYTYESDVGWGGYNMASTLGAFALGVGVLVTVVNWVRSRRRGAPAGRDPWRGETLEWYSTSPPAAYNVTTVPTVRAREPMWDQPELASGAQPPDEGGRPLTGGHLTLSTSALDARPQAVVHMPHATPWPFLLTLALVVVFTGLLLEAWAVAVAGAVLSAAGLAGWFWPRGETQAGPYGGPRAFGWWGMVWLIATEATLFALLLASYFYLRFRYGPPWPPEGIGDPKLALPLVMTAVLWSSSVPVHLAERGIAAGSQRRLRAGLAAGFVLGAAFLVMTVAVEWPETLHEFGPTTNAYGSLFFTITGFHAAHVLVGLLFSLWVQARAWRGEFDEHRHLPVQNFTMYWHFVDVVWAFVLATVYLSPRL